MFEAKIYKDNQEPPKNVIWHKVSDAGQDLGYYKNTNNKWNKIDINEGGLIHHVRYDWVSGASYGKEDIVFHKGSSYIALSDNPSTEPSFTYDPATGSYNVSAGWGLLAVGAEIVQEKGDSQDKVMSQKAVTDAMTASDQKLSELEEKVINSIGLIDDGTTLYDETHPTMSSRHGVVYPIISFDAIYHFAIGEYENYGVIYVLLSSSPTINVSSYIVGGYNLVLVNSKGEKMTDDLIVDLNDYKGKVDSNGIEAKYIHVVYATTNVGSFKIKVWTSNSITDNTERNNYLEQKVEKLEKAEIQRQFSDNDAINSFVKEVYATGTPDNYEDLSVALYFSESNGGRFTFRVGSIGKGYLQLLNLINLGTKESALNTIRQYKGIYKTKSYGNTCYFLCDFSNIEFKDYSANCSYKEVTDINNSPTIRSYILENSIEELKEKVLDYRTDYDELAGEVADGVNSVFTISNPFASDSSVSVYVDGIKKFINRDYTISSKHRWIKFNNTPSAGSVIGFHYSTYYKETNANLSLSDWGLTDGKTITSAIARKYLGNALTTNDFGLGTAQYGEMVKDPTDESIDVVSFVSRSCTTKTRVQECLYCNGSSEITAAVDLYLPSASLQCLESFPSDIGWFTLQEYWCPYGDAIGTTVTKNPGYRAILGMVKFASDNHLYFDLLCQNREMNSDGTEKYTNVAHLDDREAKKFPIPFDKWITIKTYIKSGSDNNGKFKLEVVVDGVTTKIFDSTIPVMCTLLIGNTSYPNAVDTAFDDNTCLLKMYTSKDVTDYVIANSSSNEMRTLWKNLNFTLKGKL